jgi:hypothetical protein
MSYEQKDWLIRALDLSDKVDADQWQTLILSHIPVDFTGGDYHIAEDLKNILVSYVEEKELKIDVIDSYALNEDPSEYQTYDGGQLVYDYGIINGATGYKKNSAKIIANFHGHLHSNSFNDMANHGILRMSTPPSGSYNGDENRYANHEPYADAYKITWSNELKKSQGTSKDTALTFFCIDLSSRIVYAYGYGANMEQWAMSYADTNIYSVTLNLSNVFCSNNELAVPEHTQYYAELTCPDGYEIQTVTVTMGGVDVTDTVYESGIIDIAEVNGDIQIQAIATEIVSYNNLFPSLDIYAPARLQGDGTIEYDQNSCWVTESYIAVSTGDVVRILTPNGLYDTGFSQRVVVFYKQNGDSYEYVSDLRAEGCELSSDYHQVSFVVPAGTTHIRVAGFPHRDYGNVVITINQPIK